MLVGSWEATKRALPEFGNFTFVPWETDIYPKYKGETEQSEVAFMADLIKQRRLKKILDGAVGGGAGLVRYLNELKRIGYKIEAAEGNEVDPAFIPVAENRFKEEGYDVTVHRAPWEKMEEAVPSYDKLFDFMYVEGSSLTYVGGETRAENKEAQAKVIQSFGKRIESGGYLYVDTRDYDYIASIANLPTPDAVKEAFTFEPNVFYQNAQKAVTILPVYIDSTRICFHYYDTEEKKWGLLRLYRVYPEDLRESLEGAGFEIEHVYRDFKPGTEAGEGRTALIQYLAKKK